MAGKVNWTNLSLARTITVITAAALTYLGVIATHEEIWVRVLASVFFVIIFLLELFSYRRERAKLNRLGVNHEFVLGRVMRLIADLSNLAARGFDLWVVDLYLPRRSFCCFPPRRVCKLELSLHIALTDVREVPSKIELDHVLFGRCFLERSSDLWWDGTLAPSSKENRWDQLDEGDNDKIRSVYGVISANPVIDNLREDCCGLLVVHAKQDPEVVTKVLSALTEPEGKRRIAAACVDIHNELKA